MYADLVEQQTTTTGTGSYVVSGAVTGRRTFANAFADGDASIPYVATDDNGAFECGLGTWTEGTLTLARTVVLASSNANAAVSWAAGTKRIYVSPNAALMGLSAQKHNLTATVDPNVADDVNDGYAAGSIWFNGTGQRMFLCASNGAGSAVWRQIPIVDTAFATTPRVRARALLADPNSNANYGKAGINFNGGLDLSTSNAIADGGLIGMMAQTANATPENMAYMGDYATHGGIYCEGASSTTLIGSVDAIDNSSGDIKSWKVEATIKTSAAGTSTVVVGAAPATLYSGDAGASAWSIAVVGGTNECTIEVTGEAATNITWSASLKLSTAIYY